MCREIDSHEVALLVQSFDVTPAFIGLWHRGNSNLHAVAKGPEERILHLSHLLLIELTIAHEDIQELFTLGIDGEIVLTTDAEAVETTAQRQRFEGLTVD